MGYSFGDYVTGKKRTKTVENKPVSENKGESEPENRMEEDSVDNKKLDMLIEEVKLLRKEISELKSSNQNESLEWKNFQQDSFAQGKKPVIKVHGGIAESTGMGIDAYQGVSGEWNENELSSHVSAILG